MDTKSMADIPPSEEFVSEGSTGSSPVQSTGPQPVSQVTVAGASSASVDDSQLAGFFYLSSIVSDDMAEKAYELIQSKSKYIPDSYRSWFDWYQQYFKNYDSFPSWEKFLESSGFKCNPTYDFHEAGDLFNKQIAVWESDFLSAQMQKLPLKDRRDVAQRLVKTLESGDDADEELDSLSTFKVDEFITSEDDKKQMFKFPIQHLNQTCIVNSGTMISIIAPPACGKTQMALNLMYLNCIQGGMNGLYIYLENKESAYQAELRARHSFQNGMRIENSTLKRGVLKEDKQAIDRLNALEQDFQKQKKGQIYFVPFSKFNPEPVRFATQLAKYCQKYHIGIVGFDYLQQAKSFTPLKWDRREFLNEICSSFMTCCLGQFGCDPFVGIMLAQPKREAEERMLKTRGSGMSLYDAAEVSSIERGSFISLGLYTDAEMKAASSISYKLLKNRDEACDVSTSQTTMLPQYCFIGDENGQEDNSMYSMDTLDQAFDMNIGTDLGI